MFLKFLLLGVVAISYVAAAPTIESRSPGSEWTVHGFVRTCNDTANTCLYNYSVNENDGTPATPCSYTITGTSTVSARIQTYTALPGCSSAAYSLNQGWDAAGQFATLVVTNLTSQFRAFYGFGIALLQDGVVDPDQTSPSQSSGVPPAKREVELESRQGLGEWTVQDFTWESFAPLSSTYHFTLNPNENGAGIFNCTISNAPASAQEDWDNLLCAEDDLHDISWGYSTQGFAVLTVRDNTIAPGFYALFGYANVVSWTTSAAPPDNGPQAVNEA